MFESIHHFLTEFQSILISILGVIALIAIISKDSARLWVRDFWVRFPVVGDLATLSKDRTKGNHGWMRAEEKLCAIYKQYISLLPKAQFDNRIEYMRKCGDLGRTPMPIWMFPLLAVLVAAESAGFSYLLSTWIAREGTANMQMLITVAVIVVFAIVLPLVTHVAGTQFRRTRLLRSCFDSFKAAAGDSYATKTIALSSPQDIDDQYPDYVQIVNRVADTSHDRGSYWAVVAAAIAILCIATFSSVMRFKSLENELIQETTHAQNYHFEAKTEDGAGLSLDLPKDVVEPQHSADAKASKESVGNTRAEGVSAFTMLAIIFFLTQLVGFGAGYKYSFVGRESYKRMPGHLLRHDGAYADTGGISTYETYLRVREPLVDMANARLKDLQQRLEMHSSTRLVLEKSFNDYLVEQHDKINAISERINTSDQVRPLQEIKAVNHPEPAINIPDSDADEDPRLISAKKALMAISDREMQIQFYASLPPEVRDMLKPWIAKRKEDESAGSDRKKALAEAEELF